MKKIALILAIVCLLGALSACGAAKEPDPAAVVDEIIASLSIANPLDVPAERLLALYGIAAEDIAASASFTTLDGGIFPDEVVIVKAVDSAAADRVEQCLNTRLESVMAQAQNYDAESLAVAQQCKVLTQGQYVALFLSPQHEAMEAIFEQSFR